LGVQGGDRVIGADQGPFCRAGRVETLAEDLPPILERIGITPAAWLQPAEDFETDFCNWIGQAERVERARQRGGQLWARGSVSR